MTINPASGLPDLSTADSIGLHAITMVRMAIITGGATVVSRLPGELLELGRYSQGVMLRFEVAPIANRTNAIRVFILIGNTIGERATTSARSRNTTTVSMRLQESDAELKIAKSVMPLEQLRGIYLYGN